MSDYLLLRLERSEWKGILSFISFLFLLSTSSFGISLNHFNSFGIYISTNSVSRAYSYDHECGKNYFDSKKDRVKLITNSLNKDINGEVGENGSVFTNLDQYNIAVHGIVNRNSPSELNSYIIPWKLREKISENSASNNQSELKECIPPVFSNCPDNITLNCDPGYCSAIVDYFAEASGTPIPTLSFILTGATSDSGLGSGSGMAFSKGVTTVTVTASNGCSSDAICNFAITIMDSEIPVIVTCPAERFIEGCDLANIFDPPYSDVPAETTLEVFENDIDNTGLASDNCGITFVEYVDFATEVTCGYVVKRTWTVSDSAGNSASCIQDIDLIGSAIDIFLPEDLNLSSCQTQTDVNNLFTLWLGEFQAIGGCNVVVTTTPEGLVAPSHCGGSVTVFWTVTSLCEETITTDSRTFNVAMDITAPVIEMLPGPTTIDCPAKPVFEVAAVTDECGIAYALTSADITTTGSCAGSYSVTRTWTAMDGCNNASTASQKITVRDIAAPVITALPAPTTIDCPAIPVFTIATASDACGSSFTLASTDVTTTGSCAGSYSVTRTWIATDGCNNASTASQKITTRDITAPVISALPASTTINCPMVPAFAVATANDACGSSFILSSSDITINGTCSGTYSVTRKWTATDGCENISTSSQKITVVDVSMPTLTCPLNITQSTDMGTCNAIVNFAAMASDNCSNPVITYSKNPGTVFSLGNTMVTVTATDGCSNSAVCSFNVLVKDTEKPLITCPVDLTIITLPGQCVVTGLILGSPSVISDNCAVLSTSNNGLSSYPVGMTFVTWKVTDVSGNTATCAQKITIVPYTCGIPTQVYHTDTTQTTAKIKWKAGKCATGYELRLRVELAPGVWDIWSAWVPSSLPLEHFFSGLTANKFYNMQIRSICGGSYSISVNDWFHTLPIPFGGEIQDRLANDNYDYKFVEEVAANLVIVPNPASDFTTIWIEGFEQHHKTITMFDLYGKLIFNVKLEPRQNQLELELKALGVHTGMYLIRVFDPLKQKTEQLVIER